MIMINLGIHFNRNKKARNYLLNGVHRPNGVDALLDAKLDYVSDSFI